MYFHPKHLKSKINLPHGFDVYLVNQLICQFLCASQKVWTLMFQLVMVCQLNLITILKAFSRVKILFFMGCFDVDISPVKLAPCFIIQQTTGWNLLWRNIIICFYEIHKVIIMKHPYNNNSPELSTWEKSRLLPYLR